MSLEVELPALKELIRQQNAMETAAQAAQEQQHGDDEVFEAEA